jgi:myo-inositol-1(or 4)-monophosphatase
VPESPAAPAYAHELAIATEAARRAGRLQVERYERLERIVHKGERDVVTEVDTMSEELILSLLREAFPSDSFLAEESGASKTPAEERTGRTWVIDPLDGTVNYANGIPIFCVSIGLAVGGQPTVGVIYDPPRDEMFSAVAGRGAQLDGEPIRQPAKEKMSDLVLSMAMPARGWTLRERSIRKRIRVSRILGSAALSLAYVGNGRFDAFIQAGGLSVWDICAAGLIAAEGGATVTARDGGPWFDMSGTSKSIGLIAAAPAHHATLLELLA